MMDFQAPYSRNAFLNFFRDGFLPDDFRRESESVPVPFQAVWIESANLIGACPSLDLTVYEVLHASENDPRVSLSKETFRLMAHYGRGRALVLFRSKNSPNYRLSLITLDFALVGKKVTKEYSNPRRYSFFLGPEAKVRTPLEFLVQKGRIVDFEDLKKRFSLEVVNKDFYNEIAVLFSELAGGRRKIGSRSVDEKGGLRLPGLPNNEANHQQYQEFSVRLIGRLVFCWFLKKKRSPSGVPLIPDVILSKDAVDDYYYHNVLENLFFQVLNTPVKSRENYLRKSPWEHIPFLNGGLFEPHEGDFYVPDEMGASRNINTLKASDNWFRSLFGVFETYNFTIDENTAIDIELSIEPEMLGRIFENLLAEINPETGETARKNTGSYYTPRPVVEYMVDQSLKRHLQTRAGLTGDQADQVLDYSREAELLTPADKGRIIDALHAIKVIDPACGSGAFPMGVLQKMVLILQKVDPESREWAIRQLAHIPNRTLRDELARKLSRESRDYVHKLGIIQHSIYGVDIQPIAVEISKLRFFLSLIVEECIDDSVENRGIRPLPNLEFKFVCADALVHLPREESGLDPAQQNAFRDEFFDRFNETVGNYFNASDPAEKKALHGRIEELVDAKADEKFQRIMELGAYTPQKKVRDKRQLAIIEHTRLAELWTSYKNLFRNRKVDFFETRYFFPDVQDGFDLVIANPPYVRQENIKAYKPVFEEQYECYTGTADLYVYFYERSFGLLRDGGILMFISSNKYFRSGYGEKLRGFLSDKGRILQVIDFGDAPVFTAISYPSIVMVEKTAAPTAVLVKNEVAALNWEPGPKLDDFASVFKDKHFIIKQEHLTKEGWRLESAETLRLLNKIRNAGTPLGEYVKGRFYYGIKTGLNEAFVVDGPTKDRLIAEHPSSKEVLKPFLRGRDVKRWRVEFGDQWLIYIPWHFPLHEDLSIQGASKKAEGEFKKRYPAIYEHLLKYKPMLEKRNKTETGIRYEWYALQRWGAEYWKDFNHTKIVWGNLAKAPQFTFCKSMYYINAPAVFIVSNDSLLLGILNSKLCQFVITQCAATRQGGFIEFKPMYVSNITIPLYDDKQLMNISRIIQKLQIKSISEIDREESEIDLDRSIFSLYRLSERESKYLIDKI
jgi:adenine-specific DNA-methyltransferase